jgi:hypothetical protein
MDQKFGIIFALVVGSMEMGFSIKTHPYNPIIMKTTLTKTLMHTRAIPFIIWKVSITPSILHKD